MIMESSKYKKAVIICAGPVKDPGIIALVCKGCYVMAADGGIRHCLAANVRPDIWVGDMDSADGLLQEEAVKAFPDLETLTCSPIKDDTDACLCAKLAAEKGYKTITVLGGIGGKRIEHMLANIQMMHGFKEDGIDIVMMDAGTKMYCLHNEERCFDENEEGFISVFSLTDISKVSIKGLFYEYEGELKNSFALGISNEFCGRKASIAVTGGTLLLVQSEK